MSSLIEGYNYDIFISYRQKDNKHDGWVTEFVNNLKGELESTFKEEISVYFDVNPHDGLLETHDVGESLKEKLKCLIFIPIISRTYCDPKSFAWEHEFKPFVEMASKDQYGLKIKLPNGNVASRVLPVRIHELDEEDIKECEVLLGSVLRGIEFIYKEQGIDKPLGPSDNEKKNLNNTTYKIQVIKVVHAIKEIIYGLKRSNLNPDGVKLIKGHEPYKLINDGPIVESQKKPVKKLRIFLLSSLIITILLVITILFLNPIIFKKNLSERISSSGQKIIIAVLPFKNLTSEGSKNYWSDMVQDNIINCLSNSEELSIIQSESLHDIIQSSGIADKNNISTSLARSISRRLEADIFVYGSINQTGLSIRLSADSKDAILVFKKVLKLKSEEPQSYRDLGLAYEASGDMQQAIKVLYEVVKRDWNNRFPGIEIIAMNEINNIIALHPELDYSFIDKRLIKKEPVNVRVVLTWQVDNCDIDLWVTDPSGEKCFYENKLTHLGGKISKDFTDGYGPEEFMIKKAIQGEYKVQANYYGTRSQSVLAPVNLHLTFITNFGKIDQNKQEVTVRLENKKDIIDVGVFKF
jgi:TolB-like protein